MYCIFLLKRATMVKYEYIIISRTGAKSEHNCGLTNIATINYEAIFLSDGVLEEYSSFHSIGGMIKGCEYCLSQSVINISTL